MPVTNSWRTTLTRDYTNLALSYGDLSMSVSRILDVELVLTLFLDYLPGQDPDMAWAVLNGHAFPSITLLPREARRAMALARCQLTRRLGRTTWHRLLHQYKALPPPFRLYDVSDNVLVRRSTSLLPERLEVMQKVLQIPPARPLRAARYVDKPGRYRFDLERQPEEVNIPEAAIAISQANPFPQLTATRPVHSHRPPIRVSLNELYATAAWMQRHAAPNSPSAKRDWEQSVRDLELLRVEKEGFIADTELTLDGLRHLIGMVGAGKSTLNTVLTVFLARNGYRVVIVQGDVASLLRDQGIFEGLSAADPKLSAVPLVGRSTRIAHLNRLHAVLRDSAAAVPSDTSQHPSLTEVTPLLREHPGYAMLSTICPLDGLRQDVAPIPPGSEPCTTLVAAGADGPLSPRDCPLMPVCPVHFPTRQLHQTFIWLATPASLLSSSPQFPLVSEKISNMEMAMRYADVILIDEADAVQVQFDARFAPFEVLVGRQDAWLDRLAFQVVRQVYRPLRPLVGRSDNLDRWLSAHANLQRATDRLYRWLRESSVTQEWLGETYFSGERLFQDIEYSLGTQNALANTSLKVFATAYQAFVKHGVSGSLAAKEEEKVPAAWMASVQRELLGGSEAEALQGIVEWLQTELCWQLPANIQWLHRTAHRILVTLVICILEQSLTHIVTNWADAEQELHLDKGTGGLFHRLPEGLLRLVPQAPMGDIFGFQYFDPEKKGDGELRFFNIQGMGRSLLYHLHDAFSLTEDFAGPHVLLSSGTSWAPRSWRYDLHVSPHVVLRSKRQQTQVDIQCEFIPLPDRANPGKRLYVSGRATPAERIRNLRAMVNELTREQISGKSQFEQELEDLPAGRKRILLVVNSYAQAEAVGEQLAAALKSQPGEDVVTLIPDSEGELQDDIAADKLLRGRLAQFADSSARFLVAPLQAVERGHNILIDQQAAISSVYFLTRPFPVPGDLHTSIQRINAWAMRFVPELSSPDTGTAGQRLREVARRRWDEALNEQETYQSSPDRDALLWTQMVMVWQCIGRLLRGGVSARVHFVDAKWAEVSSDLLPGPDGDDARTSMALGFERILTLALESSDANTRLIADALYGPFKAALDNMTGVRRASS